VLNDNVVSLLLWIAIRIQIKEEEKKEKTAIGLKLMPGLSSAFMAMGAAKAYMARHKDVQIVLQTECEGQKKLIAKISDIDTNNKEVKRTIDLELPDNLKDKHCIEWMSRCLGIIPDAILMPSLVVENLPKPKNGRKTIIRDLSVENDDDMWPSHKWEVVVNHLKEEYDVVEIDSTTSDDAIEKISGAVLFIGGNGLGHHLAASLSKPAVVVWGKSSPENYGYKTQNNIVPQSGRDIESMSPKTVVAEIEKVLKG